MLLAPEKTSLGLEYFSSEGDAPWKMSDQELIHLATEELNQLGIAPQAAVLDGTVLRVKKAHPVCDGLHQECLRIVREFVSTLGNLQLIGRNGSHHYNNQDHSDVDRIGGPECNGSGLRHLEGQHGTRLSGIGRNFGRLRSGWLGGGSSRTCPTRTSASAR